MLLYLSLLVVLKRALLVYFNDDMQFRLLISHRLVV